MNKILALTLAVILMFAFAGCSQSSTDTKSSESTNSGVIDLKTGGYTDTASPVITPEITKLMEKATENLTSAQYTPVAYVASQVVAGTNHLILCIETPVTQNPVSTYALITVYEDLQGNAEITDVINSSETAAEPYNEDEPVDGASTQSDSPEVTDKAKEALTKACSTLAGMTYEPVALLETQVVNGFNYKIFCKAAPSVSGTGSDDSYYTILTVYANSNGEAEITNTSDFTEEGGGIENGTAGSASSKAESD